MSNISGTNIAAPIVPFTTDDTYPTHYAQYGMGGWKAVADVAARDLIPLTRLEAGAVAFVLSTSTPYYWNGTAWIVLPITGATGATGAKGAAGAVGPQGVGVAGPAGPTGAQGSSGQSAYDLAVAYGFVGSQADWLASIGGQAVQTALNAYIAENQQSLVAMAAALINTQAIIERQS